MTREEQIRRLILKGYNPLLRRRATGKWDVCLCNLTLAKDLGSFEEADKKCDEVMVLE